MAGEAVPELLEGVSDCRYSVWEKTSTADERAQASSTVSNELPVKCFSTNLCKNKCREVTRRAGSDCERFYGSGGVVSYLRRKVQEAMAEVERIFSLLKTAGTRVLTFAIRFPSRNGISSSVSLLRSDMNVTYQPAIRCHGGIFSIMSSC